VELFFDDGPAFNGQKKEATKEPFARSKSNKNLGKPEKKL
jgi:hypothetical protein